MEVWAFGGRGKAERAQSTGTGPAGTGTAGTGTADDSNGVELTTIVQSTSEPREDQDTSR